MIASAPMETAVSTEAPAMARFVVHNWSVPFGQHLRVVRCG